MLPKSPPASVCNNSSLRICLWDEMWGLCNPEPCDLWLLWLQAIGLYAGLLFEGSEIIGKCNKDHHQITAQYLDGKHSHRSHNTALSCSWPNIWAQELRGRDGHRGRGVGGSGREEEEEGGGGSFGLQCGPGHCGDRVNLPDHLAPCRHMEALRSALTGLRSTEAFVKKKKKKILYTVNKSIFIIIRL